MKLGGECDSGGINVAASVGACVYVHMHGVELTYVLMHGTRSVIIAMALRRRCIRLELIFAHVSPCLAESNHVAWCPHNDVDHAMTMWNML